MIFIFALIKILTMKKVYVARWQNTNHYEFIRCFANLKKLTAFLITTTEAHHDYTATTRLFKERTRNYFLLKNKLNIVVSLCDLE